MGEELDNVNGKIKDKKSGSLVFLSFNNTAAGRGMLCFGLQGSKIHLKMSLIIGHA